MADAKHKRSNAESILLGIYRNTKPPKRWWLRYLALFGCVFLGVVGGGLVLIEIQMWRARHVVRTAFAEMAEGIYEPFVSATLPASPSPTTPSQTVDRFDIIDINTRVMAQNDVFVTTAWVLEILSKTERPLSLYAEIKFLDEDGFVVFSDIAVGLVLPPGEEKTFRGQALIPTERTEGIVSVNVEVQEL